MQPKISKKACAKIKLAQALSCHIAMVTDKNGDIIPGSGLSVRDSEKDTDKITRYYPYLKGDAYLQTCCRTGVRLV